MMLNVNGAVEIDNAGMVVRLLVYTFAIRVDLTMQLPFVQLWKHFELEG